MACSKVFSEDILELTNEIIQYLRNDFSTLYSCILVNRSWCRLAIPLLWENPFSDHTQNYHFIEILLYNSSEKDKAQLNGYGIFKNELFSNTLFNYPSFIKHLNTLNVRISIENFISSTNNIKRFVYRSLIKTFIENEGNLHSFEIVLCIERDYEYFNYAFGLILQNPFFIHNIRNLTLCLYSISISTKITPIIPFFEFLSSNCDSISSIQFRIVSSIIVKKYLSHIIISQQNLKTILFEYNDTIPLYNSLLLLKDSNYPNTLNTVIFYYINFKNITVLNEVFNQLNVLESIHIIYCSTLDSNFIQQIINITKPVKLKSLFLNEILQFESSQLLLQKFGNHLENFEFGRMNDDEDIELKQQLLELIGKYCTNIRYLYVVLFVNVDIYPVLQLIKNNIKNLNYLTIEFGNELNDEVVKLSSIILQNLGQILPLKLEYLYLAISFNISDLEIFLRNSQNTFIRKLLIKNLMEKNDENILSFIKKYIMKKKDEDIISYIKKCIMKRKKVEYLSICNTIFYKGNIIENDDLYFLEYEVKDFKLHNIKVQEYDDLYIQARDFVINKIIF
ncbi:hypothetical protein RclHR1_16590002 [Rhizophagus clarus]|uniref:F-box domain-containing protein n=1 Tax=Rhizophagus clarus TaxID=94130 RepID=A0A2Z6RAM9_9GLOM|nr:hypothetical protein RclHR1_16590002 [Rhizophagus clarus]GES79260.1 hypothetical protein GLOIN_2v1779718 [Rhizophagus clarus]